MNNVRQHSFRTAFTTIELLVAITVIGLLLSLLLPAIQSARESSRRTQCQNNLRQFGTALTQFESSHGHFPPFVIPTELDPAELHDLSLHTYSIHLRLLPYLDQQPLFQQFDLSKQQPDESVSPGTFPPVAQTHVPLFVCPSDYSSYGNNYRVCTGTGPNAFDFPGTTYGGAFSNMRGHPAQAFRDGLSQTVAMSERIKADRKFDSFHRRQDFWFAGPVPNAPSVTHDHALKICNVLTESPGPFYNPYSGHSWYLTNYAYTAYNHAATPNSLIPDCSFDSTKMPNPSGSSIGVHKASSNHRGGVNTLFIDGHLKFISDSVDLKIWRALATRAGSDPVSENSY